MESTEHVAQECYDRVSRYVGELYAERALPEPDRRCFTIVGAGSSVVRVRVQALGDSHSVVTVLSPVVVDIEPSDALARYLVEENGKLLFGAFSLVDDVVLLNHSILGDSLDPGELKASVDVVLSTADDYDDVIVERFGGRTAVAA
jgi:hypothetical protein